MTHFLILHTPSNPIQPYFKRLDTFPFTSQTVLSPRLILLNRIHEVKNSGYICGHLNSGSYFSIENFAACFFHSFPDGIQKRQFSNAAEITVNHIQIALRL